MTMASRLFHQQIGLLPRRQISTTNLVIHRQPQSPSKWHRRSVIPRPHRRGVVTSSVAPSPDVFIERPEVMVLAESSMYDHSWKEFSTKFYPSMGLHFASIDIMKPAQQSSSELHTNGNDDAASLKNLQETMAIDLSRLGEIADIGDSDLYIPGHAPQTSTSAYAVLIARGPLQCLVAQYFLESTPLAGLVLVDPLLLPEDGRRGMEKVKSDEGENRWKTSLLDLISVLQNKAPSMYDNVARPLSSDEQNLPPLVHAGDTTIKPSATTRHESSLELELSLLQSLACDDEYKNARPLRLEPGNIPTLVCYSGGEQTYHDYYRICAERTAAFHTCGGKGDYFDQVSVLEVPKKRGAIDDLDQLGSSIYEWYDEVVA